MRNHQILHTVCGLQTLLVIRRRNLLIMDVVSMYSFFAVTRKAPYGM